MTAFSFNKVAHKVTKKPLVTVAKNFSLYLELFEATLHFPGVLFRISSAQVLYRIAVCKKLRNVQKNPVTELSGIVSLRIYLQIYSNLFCCRGVTGLL